MQLRQIIDILSIILPAVIIILGIVRLFVEKPKGINGLVMLCAVVLLLAGLVRYFILGSGGGASHNKGPKPVPLSVSKHSEKFNTSFENVLTGYFSLTDAFVKNDTAAIIAGSIDLKLALDSFKIEELKADTLIYQTALQPYENVKAEVTAITADPSLIEKKASFNVLSNELFSLMNTAKYDLKKLYWQECGKAFGEDKPGNWLSKTEKTENPYGQKDCAEIKTTLDFVPADTTKKQ
jgi:FlaG/FlaF family flagellin (archaellin)